MASKSLPSKLLYLERECLAGRKVAVLILTAVKRVDIYPRDLLGLIEENSQTLKEVYFNEVYLKVIDSPDEDMVLWIGLPGQPLPHQGVPVAQSLRNMHTLHLDVLRVTGLGYDIHQRDRRSTFADHDLTDPSGLSRSFDERFVEAVLANDDTPMGDIMPSTAALGSGAQELTTVLAEEPRPSPGPLSMMASEFDAETYQQHRNTTSHFKRCIDGVFFNHNEQALLELQRIMILADKGMNLLSEEIARSRAAQIDPTTGTLDDNPFI